MRGYRCSHIGHFARECTGKKIEANLRYSTFKVQEEKDEDPKELIFVDTMLN